MLRITLNESSQDAVELRLSGSVSGLWVGELASAFTETTEPVPSRLDLSEVTFADPPGVRLLRGLQAAGVVLSGATPFLAAQLDDEA